MRVLISPVKRMLADTDSLSPESLSQFLPQAQRLLAALQAYGVWQEKNYGKVSVRVARFTFVTDERGFLEKAMPKVKSGTNPGEVLPILFKSSKGASLCLFSLFGKISPKCR